jgi:hypothetical protein
MIDSTEASKALSDINDIAQRVRQSTIYNLASLMLIMWGALVFAGNLLSFFWPGGGNGIWLTLDAVGMAGSFAISALSYPRTHTRTFDFRMLAAFLLLLAFGIFTSRWLGHFTARQMGAFWTTYFMLFYTIAGLWFGWAFVVIGAGITVLTMVGYFLLGAWFEPWMAVVNGGGLVLGGLWMRRN